MFRFLPHLLGVVALGFLFVYLTAPDTGLYDYRAGAFRSDVVFLLVKSAAIGAGVGVGLRLRRRFRPST